MTGANEHRESGEGQARPFLQAREKITRGARERWMKAEGLGPDDREVADAKWAALRLLDDEELRAFALGALSQARSGHVTTTTAFPLTLWTGGAEHTRGGRAFRAPISDFVQLLRDRARSTAAKKEGWVVEPTTNFDGHRTNASTLAIHALFLDCDGTGDWYQLTRVVRGLGLACILYRSGGHTVTLPKWRAVFPLTALHDTSTEAGRAAWRQIYLSARVLFGALAGLTNVGFDPATDVPCTPWFLTEKRLPTDPDREVYFWEGAALDLTALALVLPPVDELAVLTPHTRAAPTALTLDDERREEIVDALSAVTASVPSDRRAIYLALPGVLLDRGVDPDDALAICEDVSARYPRSHPEKHADNIHCARTTVSRWEHDGVVTRIGTLQTIAPDVAQALDKVLPNPATLAIQRSVDALLGPPAENTTPSSLNTSAPPPPPSDGGKRPPRTQVPLGKELAPIVGRLLRHHKAERRIEGFLIDRVLRGEPLQSSDTSTEEVDALVQQTCRALGYHLPRESWQAVLDLLARSLLDFAKDTRRLAAAELSFADGQAQQKKRIDKKKRVVAERRSESEAFFNHVKRREP